VKHALPARETLEHLALDSHYHPGELAKRLDRSVRTLQRQFKAAFGLSPKVWLNKKREHAMVSLLQAGSSTSEIARKTGYNHASSFCRRFRQDFGKSPSVIKSEYAAKC
jgi:AraC-like DNA-binding protein